MSTESDFLRNLIIGLQDQIKYLESELVHAHEINGKLNNALQVKQDECDELIDDNAMLEKDMYQMGASAIYIKDQRKLS